MNLVIRQNEQIQITSSSSKLYTTLSYIEEITTLNYGIFKSRVSYIADGSKKSFYVPELTRPLNDPSECLVFMEGIEQPRSIVWDLNDKRDQVVFKVPPLPGLRIEIRTIR